MQLERELLEEDRVEVSDVHQYIVEQIGVDIDGLEICLLEVVIEGCVEGLFTDGHDAVEVGAEFMGDGLEDVANERAGDGVLCFAAHRAVSGKEALRSVGFGMQESPFWIGLKMQDDNQILRIGNPEHE